jgi:hypothetical protein
METLQGVRMVVVLSYGVVVAHHRLYVIGVHALPEKNMYYIKTVHFERKGQLPKRTVAPNQTMDFQSFWKNYP